DGVISSALGAALAMGQPVAALVGDVALLHDIGGLLAASLSDANLTVVVPNNDGGGIFSLLPVADRGSDVHFEELFHTPHETKLGELANGMGINFHRVEQADELVGAATEATGVTVIEVPIDHGSALKQRQELADLAE
ncbi:MAG: thiamine pyrophosphate-dependent enzyme, partial [bacterium]|nr:thiamine pyrophosphate-dependent enzyme [bacterium]